MLPLGHAAPAFSLCDPDQRTISRDDFEDAAALLVVFMCNHCPYVIHIRSALAQFYRDYGPKGLAMVGINANDAQRYPSDSPDRMRREIHQAGYEFPYLFDATQEVAKAYQAACTPDFFLFDRERKLVYRGQFDDSRPGTDIPVTGNDMRAAVDSVLEGRPIEGEQQPSIGCNIKWKPGNEPAYFG